MVSEGDRWDCAHLWEILRYPVMGCFTLMGLYLLIKNV
jgi:hypothetical protein